ncbi:MAG: PfkB family carbohydrate kinase [Candidatus Nanoarchaeia archaeon]
MKIACVGDIGIDYYENLNKELVGGISFNFAANAKELGADVSVISAIGNWDKDKILRVLKNKKIDFSRIKIMQGKSALQKIFLSENGERKFTGYDPGVLKYLYLGDNSQAFLKTHEIIACPLSDGLENVFETIAKLEFSGKKVADLSMDYAKFSLDLLDKYINCFDIIFIGGDKEILGAIEKKNYAREKIIVVTLGKEGSFAFHDNTKFYGYALIPSRITDTTGCGDAFQAAFTVEYFTSKNIDIAMKKGAEQAAKVIQHVGGILQ